MPCHSCVQKACAERNRPQTRPSPPMPDKVHNPCEMTGPATFSGLNSERTDHEGKRVMFFLDPRNGQTTWHMPPKKASGRQTALVLFEDCATCSEACSFRGFDFQCFFLRKHLRTVSMWMSVSHGNLWLSTCSTRSMHTGWIPSLVTAASRENKTNQPESHMQIPDHPMRTELSASCLYDLYGRCGMVLSLS